MKPHGRLLTFLQHRLCPHPRWVHAEPGRWRFCFVCGKGQVCPGCNRKQCKR